MDIPEGFATAKKKNKCFCYMDNCMAIFEFVVFLDTDPFLNVAQFYKL